MKEVVKIDIKRREVSSSSVGVNGRGPSWLRSVVNMYPKAKSKLADFRRGLVSSLSLSPVSFTTNRRYRSRARIKKFGGLMVENRKRVCVED